MSNQILSDYIETLDIDVFAEIFSQADKKDLEYLRSAIVDVLFQKSILEMRISKELIGGKLESMIRDKYENDADYLQFKQLAEVREPCDIEAYKAKREL